MPIKVFYLALRKLAGRKVRMSIDSIANFITIIRNGTKTSRSFVVSPYSNMNKAIAAILKSEGFIRDFFEQEDEQNIKKLKVVLKYVDGESAIHDLQRISKCSRRAYAGKDEIKPVIGGLGISVMSTNRGVITNKQATKLGVGGEIICTVW